MEKGGWVYIMTNKSHSVLYTGVTSNIENRIGQHKEGEGSKFASKYKVNKLVFAEHFPTIQQAIEAEKTIKDRPRRAKIELINQQNPNWDDLS